MRLKPGDFGPSFLGCVLTVITVIGAAPAYGQTQPPLAGTISEFCASIGSGSYRGAEGIPDVLVMRGCAWLRAGLIDAKSEPDLMAAAAEGNGAPGSPSWVAAFTRTGDEWLVKGTAAKQAGNDAAAFDGFAKAQHFYYLARWPHTFSPAAEAAYTKHVDAYARMAAYFDPPLEVIAFSFEGEEFTGHFRKPDREGPHPLVVLSPGIDDWKGEVNDFIDPMLEAGFATFVLDLQGTGENPIRLAPGSHKFFSAAIDLLKQRSDIDAERIGFYGLSGGGYNAVAMALTDDDIVASVNVGGPVHESFTSDWLNVTPQSIYLTITKTAGLSDQVDGREAVLAEMLPISLHEQGLVSRRENPPALLTINGEKDILAHPGEYRFLDGAGIEQDMLIFENDGHVAPRYFDIHVPFSISWLKKAMRIPSGH